MKFTSFVNRLYSVRTSAYLMSALLAIFFLGQIVPQKRLLAPEDITAWSLKHPSLYGVLEALGMSEIYTSPLALAILLLFFLNLLLVFQSRVSGVWKKCTLALTARAAAADHSLVLDVRGRGKSEVMEQLRKALKGRKFLTDDERFLAVRNRFGPLGSLLFHLSFLLLLTGGLLLYYTRSTGTAFVAEGQYFSGRPEEFRSLRPALVGGIPHLPFRLLDITPRYIDGSPVDLEARVEMPGPEGRVRTERIRVNHPLVHGDTSILIRRIDIAPVIRLEDISGEHIFEYAAVVLHVLEDRVDRYRVPFTSYEIDFKFYPDYAVEDGLEVSRSVMLNDPVFHVSVKEGTRELFNGLARPGEYREFAGLRFGIERVLYWGDFLLVKEHGGMLLWTGFILGIAGLCWRFFFFRTEVRGEVTGDTVIVSFHGEQAGVFRKQWDEKQRALIEGAFNREGH